MTIVGGERLPDAFDPGEIEMTLQKGGKRARPRRRAEAL